MKELKPSYKQTLYCIHSPFFAYAACTTFGNGCGLIQIHSDYGTYSNMWNAIGEGSLEEFVLGIDQGYFRTKLRTQLNYMGMKKENEKKLDSFIINCWPKLKEVIRAEYEKEGNG